MRVLVTGATGYVGSRLVTALLENRHQVVAATRNPLRLKRFGWFDDITPVTLDAADPESLRAAFADCDPIDVVYYLVHAIGQPGFRDADKSAAANLATAARDAGVRRIVYLGGFVPADEALSEHLTSRAEVAEALTVPDGPELVWLGAAMIIGAGSTSFEMMRYVGDRFPVIPIPSWMDNPIDPISIRDVLHYLVAATDRDRVPAGAYDISGPDTTSYRRLLKTYARISGRWHTGLPVGRVDTGLASLITGVALPVPPGLAGDLVESLDHPMVASVSDLRDRVPDPPGGLLGIDDAIALALRGLSNQRPRPVNALADPHDLANTDAAWAGGDARRLRQLAQRVTPSIARPTLGLVNRVPGPVAGALRTGLDILIALTPKVRPA
ncbi:NAD(P)H-binding protein [Mycobacterium intracellulare]|uniref:Oxidoreductase n=1 Tax=Mycobacterium intracellulare TaxID=1767 RepID=A0A7R7MTJ3_MYCIT|nr:NAD(P)H-binding protein [Mycobacterium intracellulare]MCA2250428.1 NAD(P)H-binding protein [Mycobacterium intracellulare]MCA2356714.1 NAD(P)H-binding protein [Mycobacterium intracellulare]MCA2367632.1 NAD(P)H-binding protein [Mycobacterium intracellulare]MEE3800751.1 NAD(P)H-binding protein [Mycobacterium intracellulare]UGT97640.1 NAD(P)H-binding protein [Mycobacterium intracellulare]